MANRQEQKNRQHQQEQQTGHTQQNRQNHQTRQPQHPSRASRFPVIMLTVLCLALLGLLAWLVSGRSVAEKIALAETDGIRIVQAGEEGPAGMGSAGEGPAGAERAGEGTAGSGTSIVLEAGGAGNLGGAGSGPGMSGTFGGTEMGSFSSVSGSQASDGYPEGEADDTSITLLFAGDVLLSSHVLNAYDTAGGIGGVLDENIRKEIDAVDWFMLNQEFPFSNRGEAAEDKQFTFRLPPSRVNILQEMGVDMVTLANNHALDFGVEALLDTCTTLDDAGILRVGAGADLEEAKRFQTVELQGKTIGFLGATRVIPVYEWNAGASTPGMFTTYDPSLLLQEIQAAKKICDYVVVYVHWGVEKSTIPEDYQRTMGRQYIDAGADLVIGAHPHVLQEIEYYQGKPIVYSLGNFVFGSSIPQTMLLEVTLTEAEDSGAQSPLEAELRMIPCRSAAGYTTMITDEAKVEAFHQQFQAAKQP